MIFLASSSKKLFLSDMKRNLKNQAGKEDGFWVINNSRNFIYRGHYDNGKMIGLWDCIDTKAQLVYRGDAYEWDGRAKGLWRTFRPNNYNAFFVYSNHHNRLSSGPSKKDFEMIAEVIHIF